MAKTNVAFSDCIKETYKVMSREGLLLVSAAPDGKPNVMTIGWGTIGIIWGKPIFVVMVRHSRYTHECLEKVPEFTVNVPTPKMKGIAAFCGSRSGREVDKFAKKGLEALPSANVKPPLVGQCAIHYECRVVHKNDVVPDALARHILTGNYAQGDFHRFYYGEILRCCIEPEKVAQLK